MTPATAPLRVYRAERFRERLFGLLARPRLSPGEVLALQPCAAVHTCFMRYAIDIVFLDRENRILKIVPALLPWRMAACARARCTLELAAGEARRLGLWVGDALDLRR